MLFTWYLRIKFFVLTISITFASAEKFYDSCKLFPIVDQPNNDYSQNCLNLLEIWINKTLILSRDACVGDNHQNIVPMKITFTNNFESNGFDNLNISFKYLTKITRYGHLPITDFDYTSIGWTNFVEARNKDIVISKEDIEKFDLSKKNEKNKVEGGRYGPNFDDIIIQIIKTFTFEISNGPFHLPFDNLNGSFGLVDNDAIDFNQEMELISVADVRQLIKLVPGRITRYFKSKTQKVKIRSEKSFVKNLVDITKKYDKSPRNGNEFGIFDFVFLTGTIEKKGLDIETGIDPCGDKLYLNQIGCMLRPGGLMFMILPISYEVNGHIVWNNYRSYGSRQIKQLIAGYEIVDIVKLPQMSRSSINALFVLRKPLGDYP